jgi:hypothetical protein
MDNQEEMTISIGDAAKELGVSVKTENSDSSSHS